MARCVVILPVPSVDWNIDLGRRGHGAREGPWREGIGIGGGEIVDTEYPFP